MIRKEDFEDYNEYRKALCRESQRKRRMAAAELGYCSICCKNVPDKGHKTCRACRLDISERRKNALRH